MSCRTGLSTALLLVLAACLAACAGTPAVSSAPPPDDTPYTAQDALASAHDPAGSEKSAAPVAAQSTSTPTPESTPDRLKVRVWWPDELYPAPDGTAAATLLNQFEGFRLTYTSYDLDVRRKRSNGLGGILPMLRAAAPVAPSALPDLALIRYADMVTLATEGLIVPLSNLVPGDLVGSNLLPGARGLGEVNGVLYGVPYALNISHTVYRTALFDQPLLGFDDVLAAGPVYLFPAGTTTGTLVNETALAQYLAAGGRLADDLGNPILNHDPLLAVLRYYEQGLDGGLFTPALLEQTGYAGYWTDFETGEASVIGVDTLTYLAHEDAVPNVGLSPTPTLDGGPITLLDGWVWALTTQDPDRQRQAIAFLSWMMRVSQHSLFTEAMNILPSQSRALLLWDDAAYAEFAGDLITHAVVLPTSQRSSSAAQALQDSVVAVLEGTPADTAADSALAQLPASTSWADRADRTVRVP
ncbi:MAG: extracellular solute-binding protein [Anaerolineae bacterium]|nr:extracellular solute-binding protein [Anaerolineae bacterium]